jgi:hypothetical protein
MDKQEQVQNIIQYLEMVRERPKFHFTPNPDSVYSFTRGFNLACQAIGLYFEDYQDTYLEVQKVHGWQVNALHPFQEMVKRGWTDSQVVHEVLTLEIETWEKVYEHLKEDIPAK